MLPFERLVAELQEFDPGDAHALTVYLRTDPSREAGRNRRAQLIDLLRPLREALEDRAELAALDAAAGRVQMALDRLASPPRSAAVFVCTPRSFERLVPLPDLLAPRAFWGDRLDLAPLLAALDEHERMLVVLLDKARARLFQVCMGEIEELEAFEDEVPALHRQGPSLQRAYQGPHSGVVGMGYDSPTIQRHHMWHVRQHVDRTIATLARGDRAAVVDRIMVGGPVEAVSEFRRLLPRRFHRRLAGEVRVPVAASSAEVLEVVRSAGAVVERAAEVALVDELIERPARSRLGLAAVTEAVADHQVHSLVYAAGTSAPGAECRSCGWLTAGEQARPACPRCGGSVEPVGDLVDLMVSRVLEHGGRVEEVRGDAAERLRIREGIGVLLRWVPAPAPAPMAGGPEKEGRRV